MCIEVGVYDGKERLKEGGIGTIDQKLRVKCLRKEHVRVHESVLLKSFNCL